MLESLQLYLIGQLNSSGSREVSFRVNFTWSHLLYKMRTVDPEKWSKAVIKPKSIFESFSYKRRPRGLESLLKDSFVDSMKEFWANSSIGGHKYFDSNKLFR